MEILQIRPQKLQPPKTQLINSMFLRRKFKFFLNPSLSNLKPFSASNPLIPSLNFTIASALRGSVRVRPSVTETTRQLKENWLDSLSCAHISSSVVGEDLIQSDSDSNWVIGVDPDVSGALALLRNDESGFSAQVFDSPHLKVMVGKSIRKRLDAKSIVHLLRSFDAPIGTTAYIEQSIPYPQDGKQGWWSGGFGYGLWIGILVASGFSVVPVPSTIWKNKFEISGSRSTKDESRRVASILFPSLSSSLQRKKDHGRAEALLIAAYGKGLELKSDSSSASEELP